MIQMTSKHAESLGDLCDRGGRQRWPAKGFT